MGIVHTQRSQNRLIQDGKQSAMIVDRKNSRDEVDIARNLHLHLFNHVWTTKFKELLFYKQCHGNCNVPHHYSKNPKLANWIIEQRVEYKENHPTSIKKS